jgi:hypothetical protein
MLDYLLGILKDRQNSKPCICCSGFLGAWGVLRARSAFGVFGFRAVYVIVFIIFCEDLFFDVVK